MAAMPAIGHARDGVRLKRRAIAISSGPYSSLFFTLKKILLDKQKGKKSQMFFSHEG